MSEKYSRRVKQYLDDLNDERDDLFKNVTKLINIANHQVNKILKSGVLSEKETLQTFLRKILLVFSEINNSVVRSLETCPFQETLPALVEDQTQTDPDSDLRDFLKEPHAFGGSFIIPTEGPKIPNTQVLNDSYSRKPLNDTTLKAICSTFLNKSQCTNNNEELAEDNGTAATENCLANNEIRTGSLIQHNMIVDHPHHSRTFSQGTEAAFSTASASVLHPLMKFNPPTEIPKQYDTTDLDKIKENMIYFSRKMGFDSEELANLANHFDKASSINQCQDVEYGRVVLIDKALEIGHARVKEENGHQAYMHDISEGAELNTAQSQHPGNLNNGMSLQSDDYLKLKNHFAEEYRNNPYIPDNIEDRELTAPQSAYDQKLNNATNLKEYEDLSLPNDQSRTETSQSTGAIRKIMDADMGEKYTSDTTEASNYLSYISDSELSSQLKVRSWLAQENKQIDQGSIMCGGTSHNGNAIEKLERIKRMDRDEEARKIARNDMPDLKLVPVKVPKVIKNDLNWNTASVKSSKVSKPKTKVKDLNQERSLYEGPKVEWPELHSNCVFSHIISPVEFYIQILTETNYMQLDMISRTLHQQYKNSECTFSTKQAALSKMGKFCCGVYCGASIQWYRFKVLDWKMDSLNDEVEVQSIDYGFKCILPFTSLRELPSKIADVPVLAIKCYLPFLFPPGSTYSNRLSEWPKAVTEALYDIANISCDPTEPVRDPTIFVIVFSNLDGDSLAVDLGYFSDLNEITLGMQLAEMGLANEIIDDYAGYEELGEFLEDVDELEQAENLNEFIWGFDAKDEKRICRFTRNDGSCFKGKNCKLEHILLKDGYTTDKSAIFYTAINDPIFPKKFETVVVLVTVYVDSCTYIAQVVRNATKKDDSGIVMDKSVSELMEAINHPKKISKFEQFKGFPCIGEVILALHPIAKKWMRVLVKAIKKNFEEVSIEAHSVDFGEQFFVNIKNTRVMQEDFMHLPFQTFQIYLDNYQHRAGCDENKARKFFSRHIEYRTFMASIKNSMPPFKVSLTTFKGSEIGPTLVNEGFAEKRTIAIDISDNENKRGLFDVE